MPLHPTTVKEVLRIVVELRGPIDKQKYDDFQKAFDKLMADFGAKVDAVLEKRA